MAKLTIKQEKYVQGLIAGLSQRQAYREAYPASQKWRDSAVDSQASRTLKNPKVFARYEGLIDEHKEKALWTREKAVSDLIWLKEQARTSIIDEQYDEGYVRQGTANAYLGAVQELNKLEDLYPSEKIESTVSMEPVMIIDDIPEDDDDGG